MSERSGAAKRSSRREERGGHDGGDHALKAPLSEWIVAGVSALLVLAMLVYTAAEGLRRPGGAAVLTVTADSVVTNDGAYVVMFTLTNDGGETAASVHVHGALRRNEAPVEESEVVLDYVPAGARRRGALQFRRAPAAHELILRVTGFSPP